MAIQSIECAIGMARSREQSGWSHVSESRLVCPRCHPDKNPNSNPSVAASATGSAALPNAPPSGAPAAAGAIVPAQQKKRNKGGRDPRMRPREKPSGRGRKPSIIYHRHQELAKAANKKSKKRIRVKVGAREKLITKAKAMYNIKDENFLCRNKPFTVESM